MPNPIAVRLCDAALGFLLRPRVRRLRRWAFLATVPLGFLVGRSVGLDLGDGVALGVAAEPLPVTELAIAVDHPARFVAAVEDARCDPRAATAGDDRSALLAWFAPADLAEVLA